MKRNQQSRLDSLRRVQDFLDANAGTVSVLAGSEARKQLNTAVAALAGLGTHQGATTLLMAGQVSRKRSIATELKSQHMTPIAAFARARLRGVPEYAALTRSCMRLENRSLIRAARAVAVAAAPHASELAMGGFPPDTIAQLEACADALQSALEERANMNVARVQATSGIDEQLQSGREAVAMLHAAISRQFANDPTFLVAWGTARRIVAKPGRVRATAAASPTPTLAPPASAVA